MYHHIRTGRIRLKIRAYFHATDGVRAHDRIGRRSEMAVTW